MLLSRYEETTYCLYSPISCTCQPPACPQELFPGGTVDDAAAAVSAKYPPSPKTHDHRLHLPRS